ncbi:hypothetical protein [Thermogladius sp.]|uniref:hypothetical protein n=1 Tax=Thermogladius sp. TaxID=2023064 RepID=UPI003D11B1F1
MPFTADDLREKSLLFKLLVPRHGFLKPKRVYFRHVSVFGTPESGKTTFVLWFLRKIEEVLDLSSTNFIAVRCMRLQTCLDTLEQAGLPNKPYYIALFVDDAEAFQTSHRALSAENVASMLAHNNIRHLVSRMGIETAFITLVYATQRFRNLQLLMRQGHAVVFKALAINDPSEELAYRQWLGDTRVDELLEVTRRIYVEHDDTAKGYAYIRAISGDEEWLYRQQSPDDTQDPVQSQPIQLIDRWGDDIEYAKAGPLSTNISTVVKSVVSRLPAVATLYAPKEIVMAIAYAASMDPSKKHARAPSLLKVLGVINPSTGEVNKARLEDFLAKTEPLLKLIGVERPSVTDLSPGEEEDSLGSPMEFLSG